MFRPLLLVTTIVLVAAVGQAQRLPSFSGAVVVTATGEPLSKDEVAAATTVIDRFEIDSAGVATAAELLRRVPGATLLRSGLDNGVTTLFVRGTSAAHTLVLWDGVRLNSPFFGGYDWSMPLLAGVDRIEFVRGPFSALYGADAVGGVVQLLPRRAAARSFSALVEGGGQRWRRGELTTTVTGGQLDLTVTGARRTGSGAQENDDFASQAWLVNAGYTIAADSRVAVLLNRTTTRTEIPFSGALRTPHRSTSATETLAAVPLRLGLGAGREIEVTLSRVERSMRFRDPDDPSGFTASDTEADSNGARLVFHQRWDRHGLVVGGEWRRDEVTDGSSYGVNLAGRALATRSAFVQDSVELGHRVALLAGVRWDATTAWGKQLSPRLTVSWQGQASRSWVSWGRAFRAPALGELYYPYSGNPALAPERSRCAEVGVSWSLVGSRTALQVVAFTNRIDDLVEFDFASFRFANTARAAQDGVELGATAPLGRASWLDLSLTWLDARDGDGVRLLRRPVWSGAATLRAPVIQAATAELTLVWVGPRPDLDPVTFGRVGQPGFLTASAGLSLPVADWLSVRVRAENLANRSYEEVRGYPAPGRRLFAGLELKHR